MNCIKNFVDQIRVDIPRYFKFEKSPKNNQFNSNFDCLQLIFFDTQRKYLKLLKTWHQEGLFMHKYKELREFQRMNTRSVSLEGGVIS
jgi:hypothetical protein